MVSSASLNLDRIKADRLERRIADTRFLQVRLRSKLEGRYKTFSKRAEEMERKLAPHLGRMEGCCQKWVPGMAIGARVSKDGASIESGAVYAIAYIPSNKSEAKSIEFLSNMGRRVSRHLAAVDWRMNIRGLRKEKGVQDYFRKLNEDGDFLRLYDIYRSTDSLRMQGTSPVMINKFLYRKLSALVEGVSCECSECLLRALFHQQPSAAFLFNIAEIGLTLERTGRDKAPITSDNLLPALLLKARNEGWVVNMIAQLALADSNRDDSGLFDKIMKGMPEIHKDK